MSDANPSLVERRQRFIERQRELHKETVNVRFERLSPEGSGPTNRHGRPTVPVGQHLVKNWPVLDLGGQPDVTLKDWRLEGAGPARRAKRGSRARFVHRIRLHAGQRHPFNDRYSY
jgi:DMSO/TMAO reductase YedYZ molybdopterin-dependent catalytic subunit